MKHMLDHIGIYVVENGEKYVYKRILDDNGIPNYFPPPDKNKIYHDMYVDEVLFLPIELDDFNKDRINKFIGFRYMINSSGHQTITLGPDPLKLGVTDIQLTVEIQRIRFYVEDKYDLIIDRVFDPLYPPRILNIETPTHSAGKQIQQIVRNTIAEYNRWYINKTV